MKRVSVPDDSEPLSKKPKLTEFSDNILSPFLDSQSTQSPMSTVLPDLMFDGVITGPVHTMDIDLHNCSINNLTPLMQRRIASIIGLNVKPILMIREPLHRPLTNNLLHYYCSLENRLANTFHINISLVPVFPDGNCLYRALSHIIFGNESKFEMLKQNLIGRFMSSPEHFLNVMEKSGLFSEQ